jgi:hypothetical protein
MNNPSYKAQVIIEDGSWPYAGNAYINRDGSISLLLDRGIKLELPDGVKLEASGGKAVKLFLRTPRTRSDKAAHSEAGVTAGDKPKSESGAHLMG